MVSALTLNPDESPPVTMIVLKSYDQATAFLNHLRQLLAGGGFGSGSGRQHSGLLHRRHLHAAAGKTGRRRSGTGRRRLPLSACTRRRPERWPNSPTPSPECATALRTAQQRLLDAERLATIGRMASSISHDLRHPLTAVLANAEFLADAELTPRSARSCTWKFEWRSIG